MKNTLFAFMLMAALAGCAGDAKGPDYEKQLDAPKSGDAAKTPQDATSAEAAKPANGGPATPADAAPASGTAGTAPDTKTAAAAKPADTAAARDPEPAYREITIPAGTVLPLRLANAVGSDTSHVEDPVRATLRNAIVIRGAQVIPAGTTVLGHVTGAARSARVKGRARVAFRFNQIDLPGEGGRMAIRTGTVARVAPGTKKQDAAKIGAGAAGGAIVGGILGGGTGAAKGAAIGGGAGTGVVLATRGKEVRLAAGTPVSVRLTAPLTVRVRR